ncbi:RdRP-domain-containing protein [Trametes versicolor FP-101664 SS1]|uniref:RdRP-domain-containing protein n=1 Tax=Trametes versicolor (strain FP-101664) TaxID=717944 RepID=UPI000462217D|nr:RdRP-domain-containing protein [Trametes versicolor FP-101664 SS1]EIW57530.1 RdRP-domain-containing protein [Trametes versicolor FP-101664 SS1]
MEIQVSDLNYSATVWDVKRGFAQALHSELFYNPNAHKSRRVNFRVQFKKEGGPGSLSNDGTATLIVPDRKLGDDFLRWAFKRGNNVRVDGRRVWLRANDKRPSRAMVESLLKTPYIDPTLEEERAVLVGRIGQIGIVLDAIQFGVYYRRPDDPPEANRRFSNEYEIRRTDTFAGKLCFDYNHKLLRIEMGNSVTEYNSTHIVTDTDNIKKVAYGVNAAGQYYVCFDLYCPPRFERQQMYRTYTGEYQKDNKGFRERLTFLDKPHQSVGPFAFQLRVVLNDPSARKDLKTLCYEAGVRSSGKVQIDTDVCGFYRPETMRAVRSWIMRFEWPVAFQLEALLRNGLLNTGDMLDLRTDVEELHQEDPDFAADALRHFFEKLQSKQRSETVVECFKNTLAKDREVQESLSGEDADVPESKGTLKCFHVIVTPTRILLEGPYDTQSNRVVRKYHDYRENFVRVEFRDENRMAFRWPKEVNSASLIEERFGTILKEGLEIAGRRFRFLGYSNSGLREHTTWFMSDFEHPDEGLLTPDRIRDSLGNFSNVNTIPSKYAARIAQAFSGTDPSVRIRRDQWDDQLADLGKKPFWHTDGQGTISVGLRDEIWDVLVKAQPDKAKLTLKPSAYQIRFLGFKGIVVVDETLEGVYMRLRPTMNKFKAHADDEADAEIEIAKAFIYPGTARLCRPLIMVLEDLGVRKEAMLELQNLAKAVVVTASDSMGETINLLRKHALGDSFGLRHILEHLRRAGMCMRREAGSPDVMDNDFILQLVKYAQHHILHEIKHDARIPIPNAHQLVGVADEGPAYMQREEYKDKEVFCLGMGEIFACVEQPDGGEPLYVKGQVTISRSPHIHPGDVQRVRAIGKPPDDKLCLFRNLRNVVVLPSVGERSLASCLAGGDVDGDEFLVIKDPTLLPTTNADPASYDAGDPRDIGRPSTIDDICNFLLEYMQSDVMGLVADQHLKIADCMVLARLCSQAVDYPKNGVPVNLESMPEPLIRAKPDWKKSEDNDPRPSDYYESTRALGALFRNFEIKPLHAPETSYPNGPPGAPVLEPPLSDSISRVLRPAILRRLGQELNTDADVAALEPLFQHYAEELRYICLTHALAARADVRLAEEEVAIGTILAKCTQARWRRERMHRMRVHAGQLVRSIQRGRLRAPTAKDAGEEELVGALRRAWLAWDYGMRNRSVFGARSFGLIALGVVCEMLEKLEKLDRDDDGLEVDAAGENDEDEEDRDC